MLYIVLLHYPVYNKEGKIVTTAIANMDIHDIARLAKTYGVQEFYVVNPIVEQRNLAQKLLTTGGKVTVQFTIIPASRF